MSAPLASTSALSTVGPRRVDRSPLARITSQPAVVAIVALIAAGAILVALNGPTRELAVAAFTDAPSPTSAPAAIGSGLPSPTALGETAAPTGSSAPQTPPGQTFVPVVIPTRSAPGPTPRPTPTPAPTPTPRRTAPPNPTPTATPFCTVIDLVGKRSNQAPALWLAAGFTGTVSFSTPVPPQFTIVSQSLTPGASIKCTSGITVRDT
jgi:hypothetical protein